VIGLMLMVVLHASARDDPFGSPAVCMRPVALRHHLAVALPLSRADASSISTTRCRDAHAVDL
jgi:hypothetical protein